MAPKDRMTPSQRSYCMSQVKSKNSKIERIIFHGLMQKGLVFQRHVAGLPGNPDIVFPDLKLAIFVDGDFWHGHNYREWEHKLKPYWKQKIRGNMRRDIAVRRRLRREGWVVLRIREKAARKNLEGQLNRILRALKMRTKNAAYHN